MPTVDVLLQPKKPFISAFSLTNAEASDCAFFVSPPLTLISWTISHCSGALPAQKFKNPETRFTIACELSDDNWIPTSSGSVGEFSAAYSSNGIIHAVAHAVEIPEDQYAERPGRNLAAKKKSHGHIVKHVIENQEEYEKKVKEYEK